MLKQFMWVLHYANRFFGGGETATPALLLIVPVGISYYILKAISYVVDVAKRKLPCERNFAKYLLYLSYFPAIVQGPISGYGPFAAELGREKKFDYDRTRESLLLILFGLVKKMVIADRAAIFANACFSGYDSLHGFTLYFGAVCYAVQIYGDFSGCVDICRGTSKLFDIRLPENFRAPYLATSIKDFWRRWHMSFSGWLKEYVYIPLGGNRKGRLRKYINILVTFLVSGIWHGAGTHFIVWGLLHGVYQVAGELLAKPKAKVRQLVKLPENSFSHKFLQIFLTFHLVTLAWIFFRADAVSGAVMYIRNMFTDFSLWTLFTGEFYTHGLGGFDIVWLLLHVTVLVLVDWAVQKGRDPVSKVQELHLLLRWPVYLALIMDVLLFGIYGNGFDVSGFLYGGF